MIKKQFTLYLQNRPGVLARTIQRLGKDDINIEGMSACTSPDVGLVQLVVSHAARARRVFNALNIAYTTQDVALLKMSNEPGSLARVASELAAAEVNINYLYGTGHDGEGKAYVILSAPDLEKVEKAWKKIAG